MNLTCRTDGGGKFSLKLNLDHFEYQEFLLALHMPQLPFGKRRGKEWLLLHGSAGAVLVFKVTGGGFIIDLQEVTVQADRLTFPGFKKPPRQNGIVGPGTRSVRANSGADTHSTVTVDEHRPANEESPADAASARQATATREVLPADLPSPRVRSVRVVLSDGDWLPRAKLLQKIRSTCEPYGVKVVVDRARTKWKINSGIEEDGVLSGTTLMNRKLGSTFWDATFLWVEPDRGHMSAEAPQIGGMK